MSSKDASLKITILLLVWQSVVSFLPVGPQDSLFTQHR